MNEKYIWAGVALVIGLLTGITVCNLTKESIIIKPEVSIADIFNYIITLCVAFIIGFVLNKKYENRRFEKDLLIERVADSKGLLVEYRNQGIRLQSTAVDAPDLNASARKLSSSLHSIEEKFKIFECHSQLENDFETVKRNLQAYRSFMSEMALPESSATMESADEDRQFRALRDSLDRLIRGINRM